MSGERGGAPLPPRPKREGAAAPSMKVPLGGGAPGLVEASLSRVTEPRSPRLGARSQETCTELNKLESQRCHTLTHDTLLSTALKVSGTPTLGLYQPRAQLRRSPTPP